MKRSLALGALLLLAALLPPLARANGGIARLVREPLGPYLVTVYSSPTPLRTGEVDVSVLVQDSASLDILEVPVVVEAVPLSVPDAVESGEGVPEPIRKRSTREQATNKLFVASKFDIDVPAEYEFRIEVAEAGELSFRSAVVKSTLLDRPFLLAFLVLVPVALIGWLLTGRGEEEV